METQGININTQVLIEASNTLKVNYSFSIIALVSLTPTPKHLMTTANMIWLQNKSKPDV